MDMTMQWAIAKIIEKAHPDFYGSVTISFQAGKPKCVKAEETFVPEVDLSSPVT